MRHADNRGLRETLYRAWVTRASDQGANPSGTTATTSRRFWRCVTRLQASSAFDNYAEYSLATKMAGSTREVIDFLRELAARSGLRPRKRLPNSPSLPA